jgi:hypothetical protein
MDKVSVQLPPAVRKEVKEAADRRGLSVAAYIRMLVIESLEIKR